MSIFLFRLEEAGGQELCLLYLWPLYQLPSQLCSLGEFIWWAWWVRASPKRDLSNLNSESIWKRPADFPLVELDASFVSILGLWIWICYSKPILTCPFSESLLTVIFRSLDCYRLSCVGAFQLPVQTVRYRGPRPHPQDASSFQVLECLQWQFSSTLTFERVNEIGEQLRSKGSPAVWPTVQCNKDCCLLVSL